MKAKRKSSGEIHEIFAHVKYTKDSGSFRDMYLVKGDKEFLGGAVTIRSIKRRSYVTKTEVFYLQEGIEESDYYFFKDHRWLDTSLYELIDIDNNEDGLQLLHGGDCFQSNI